MKEQLISFETAKLAKEKGFNEETFGHHYIDNNDDHLFPHAITGFNEALKWNSILEDSFFKALYRGLEIKEIISVPTQSFLQQWLREKHNIYVIITEEFYANGINHNVQILTYDSSNVENNYINNNKSTKMYGDNGEFKNHEEALEFGLQKALKLIENDNN